MGVLWTDFEACAYERIAYYQMRYEQATRIYYKLLKQDCTTEKQLADVLQFQQAMADELSRYRRMLVKYIPKRITIDERIVVDIEPVRLN